MSEEAKEKQVVFKTRIYDAKAKDFKVWIPGPDIAARNIKEAVELTSQIFLTVDQEGSK